MHICLIRTFRILCSPEMVKYIQHMLAGGWHVHQRTRKEKMTDLFVLVTCGTEPFLSFVRILDDQSGTLTTTLTMLTCALFLTFTLRFPYVIIEAYLTPKVSVT